MSEPALPEGTHCLLFFDSVRTTMKAERLLADRSVPAKLIPTPPEFSSECGVVLQVECLGSGPVLAALRAEGIEPKRMCAPG